jgi:hypothetical protein
MDSKPSKHGFVYVCQRNPMLVEPIYEVATVIFVSPEGARRVALLAKVGDELTDALYTFIQRSRIRDMAALFEKSHEMEDTSLEDPLEQMTLLIALAGRARTIAIMRQKFARNIAIDGIELDAAPVEPDQKVLRRTRKVLKVAFGDACLTQKVQIHRDQRPRSSISDRVLQATSEWWLGCHCQTPSVMRPQEHRGNQQRSGMGKQHSPEEKSDGLLRSEFRRKNFNEHLDGHDWSDPTDLDVATSRQLSGEQRA